MVEGGWWLVTTEEEGEEMRGEERRGEKMRGEEEQGHCATCFFVMIAGHAPGYCRVGLDTWWTHSRRAMNLVCVKRTLLILD